MIKNQRIMMQDKDEIIREKIERISQRQIKRGKKRKILPIFFWTD